MKYAIDGNTLTAIADAIRMKTATEDAMTTAEMPGKIIGIVPEDKPVELQNKSVSPSEDAQTVYPDIDQGYVGLSSVTVEGISSTYVGSGVPRKTAATITPSKSVQTAVDAGTYASGDIKVGAIPDNYIVPSGTKAITQNGTHDVNAYQSVSVNVAASGTAVQRKAGSFTTDSTGTATVNCGFQPDVVLFTDLFDSYDGEDYEYHAAVVFPEVKQSDYWLATMAYSNNFPYGVEFYVERTTNGFSVEVYKASSNGSWSTVKSAQFPYVAIKYT